MLKLIASLGKKEKERRFFEQPQQTQQQASVHRSASSASKPESTAPSLRSASTQENVQSVGQVTTNPASVPYPQFNPSPAQLHTIQPENIPPSAEQNQPPQQPQQAPQPQNQTATENNNMANIGHEFMDGGMHGLGMGRTPLLPSIPPMGPMGQVPGGMMGPSGAGVPGMGMLGHSGGIPPMGGPGSMMDQPGVGMMSEAHGGVGSMAGMGQAGLGPLGMGPSPGMPPMNNLGGMGVMDAGGGLGSMGGAARMFPMAQGGMTSMGDSGGIPPMGQGIPGPSQGGMFPLGGARGFPGMGQSGMGAMNPGGGMLGQASAIPPMHMMGYGPLPANELFDQMGSPSTPRAGSMPPPPPHPMTPKMMPAGMGGQFPHPPPHLPPLHPVRPPLSRTNSTSSARTMPDHPGAPFDPFMRMEGSPGFEPPDGMFMGGGSPLFNEHMKPHTVPMMPMHRRRPHRLQRSMSHHEIPPPPPHLFMPPPHHGPFMPGGVSGGDGELENAGKDMPATSSPFFPPGFMPPPPPMPFPHPFMYGPHPPYSGMPRPEPDESEGGRGKASSLQREGSRKSSRIVDDKSDRATGDKRSSMPPLRPRASSMRYSTGGPSPSSAPITSQPAYFSPSPNTGPDAAGDEVRSDDEIEVLRKQLSDLQVERDEFYKQESEHRKREQKILQKLARGQEELQRVLSKRGLHSTSAGRDRREDYYPPIRRSRSFHRYYNPPSLRDYYRDELDDDEEFYPGDYYYDRDVYAMPSPSQRQRYARASRQESNASSSEAEEKEPTPKNGEEALKREGEMAARKQKEADPVQQDTSAADAAKDYSRQRHRRRQSWY
ncbi:uncharacterized protein VTP21DRAFT_2403 [Calcarisporiella thermophila]|uniref:uncharacterized protein n=1 Tax=Calcarisporiella thermophila TaxID=911321 RepID=UPI0037427CE2